MIEIDARGLSCPVPVVKVKKALSKHPEEEITVLVDAEVQKENVSRLADSHGCSVEVEEDGDGFRLILRKVE